MPRRGWALIIALGVFAVAVISVLVWASASGRAGSQRGLVIFSTLPRATIVRLADGQEQQLGPERREYTFVVKREQFPSVIGVYEIDGARLHERTFEYEFFAEADFRISFDERGFYRTTDLREPDKTRTAAAAATAGATPAP